MATTFVVPSIVALLLFVGLPVGALGFLWWCVSDMLADDDWWESRCGRNRWGRP